MEVYVLKRDRMFFFGNYTKDGIEMKEKRRKKEHNYCNLFFQR